MFMPDPDLDFLPIPDPRVKKAPDPGCATLRKTERMCSFARINHSGVQQKKLTLQVLHNKWIRYRYLVGFCQGRHAAELAASSCGRRRPPHRWAAPGPPVRSASLYRRRHRRPAAGRPQPRWRSRLRRAAAAWRCVRRAARPQIPPACRVGNKIPTQETKKNHLKNPLKNVLFFIFHFLRK